MPMKSDPKYWFPAKRYGWGWGLPITWQGWLVLAAYVALIWAGAILFPPRQELAAFLLYMSVLLICFIGVCWAKGEPPRWRWGDHR